MSRSVADLTNGILRRRRGSGESTSEAKVAAKDSRNSSQIIVAPLGQSSELGLPIGREGNDWPYPDSRGPNEFNHDPGKRLQDFANSHLNEGPNPGRIPHQWNNRRLGKTGREISGNPIGDNFLTLEITGIPTGGAGDGRYIPHQVIPRGSVQARAYSRTVDDAANIPAVYVSDPTRS